MENGFDNVNTEEQPVYTPPQPVYEPPQQTVYIPQQVSPKSRKTALFLAIFLGDMGINRLYLGTSGGVGRLIMFIIFVICDCCCLIPYVGIIFAFVVIGLAIPITIGHIKDIIYTSKGQMTDGQGLPVTTW